MAIYARVLRQKRLPGDLNITRGLRSLRLNKSGMLVKVTLRLFGFGLRLGPDSLDFLERDPLISLVSKGGCSGGDFEPIRMKWVIASALRPINHRRRIVFHRRPRTRGTI